MSELSICMVTFQNRDCVCECLRSLRAAAQNPDAGSAEIILVDNASTDGTVETVRAQFPEVRVLAKSENSGFAAANNDALRLAGGRFLLLLNPDTIVPQGALQAMVRFMDDRPDAGVVGCRLVNPDGSAQHSVRAFPTVRAALHQFTAIRHLGLFRKHYNTYRQKEFDYSHTAECDSVMGAAFLTRREVLEAVGLLDERYFMYYEEVDFCKRVRDSGRKVYYFPDVSVTHLAGQSAHYDRRLASVSRMRSLVRYFARHRGRGAATLFKLVFVPMAMARALVGLPSALIRAGVYRFLRADPYRAQKNWAQFKARVAFLAWDWTRVAAA